MCADSGDFQRSGSDTSRVHGKQDSLFDFNEIEDDRSDTYKTALKTALHSISCSQDSRSGRKPSVNASFKAGRQRIQGTVSSSKMDKTIVVRNDRATSHPLYVKRVRATKKFKAHDEFNLAKEGDFVQIVECRPISKTKRWRLEAILRRPGLSAGLPSWLLNPPLVRLSIPELAGDRLKNDRTYTVEIHLANEQHHLFGGQLDPHPDRQLSQSSAAKASAPTLSRESLIIRLGGPQFYTIPAVAKIVAGHKSPIVEPSSVVISPKKTGILDFNMSILIASTGELIQSQTFQLTVD